MIDIITYSREEIAGMMQKRQGEIKLGEQLQTIESSRNWIEELDRQNSQFAIIGIAEDIGVRANFGRRGTATAWDNFLKNFVNTQHNAYCNGRNITLLGHINIYDEMTVAEELHPSIKHEHKRMFELVERVDRKVQWVIEKVVASGKIPIVIGGGHNNAYGNIKGTAQAKGKSINVVNLDAHTDLRPTKGRHSGNGFSFAIEEKILNNYFIFGLHENYLSASVHEMIVESAGQIKFNTYEEVAVRGEKEFHEELTTAYQHIKGRPFGVELDLDSLPDIASSAITPSGFSVEQARQYLHYFAQFKEVAYLHLCEAAPALSSYKNPNMVGKLLAFMVTDFVKSHMKGK